MDGLGDPRTGSVMPRRLTGGDPVRGIGALIVVLFHSALYFVLPVNPQGTGFGDIVGPLGAVLEQLDWVVFLFFVLSGYLIGRPFTNALVLERRMPRLPTYFMRRLLRILPAFWVAWSLTLLIQQPEDSLGGILSTYALAQIYTLAPSSYEISQAWTVDIEIAFYLALPFGVLALAPLTRRLATPRARATLLLGVLFVAFWPSWLMRSGDPDSIVWVWNPVSIFWSFIPGLALAILEPFAAWRVAGTRTGRRMAWALLAVAAVGIAWSAVLEVAPYRLTSLATLLATGGLIGAMLVWQWTTDGCPRWLNNKPLQWMGERSYSLYLLHVLVLANLFPLVEGIESAKLAWLALMAMGVPACLLAAAISYRFVEKPFLGAKPRLSPRPLINREARAPARP